MVKSLTARAAFAQFAHKTRKARATQTRLPWRTRKKRTRKNGLTTEERKELRRIRQEKRDHRDSTIADAVKKLEAIAQELAETLGDHDAKYYFRLLTQQARKSEGKKKGNLWNAFLHKETRRRIDGMYYPC